MSEVVNTLKAAKQLNEAVEKLYGCTTGKDISEIFDKYNINSPEDKKYLLHECMETEAYFYSANEELSPEDEYNYAEAVFLEGTWRLLTNG